MLTEVKNQFKVTFLSFKYALMKEMLNKTTFITNIVFMILNNASFIIQILVLFSIKNDFGGYTFKEMLLLWGVATSTFGFFRCFFKSAFSLADTINNGKLDAYLVQPKNVLISAITSTIDVSAIGDMIYAFIMLFLYGFSFKTLLLFILFMICGGLVITSVSVISSSLSFWFNNSSVIADVGNNLMINFGTYPDGIFKGLVKILLFTLIPVGIVSYIPVHIIVEFNIYLFLVVILVTFLLVSLAFIIFNKGLKRYSSSNLMSARI